MAGHGGRVGLEGGAASSCPASARARSAASASSTSAWKCAIGSARLGSSVPAFEPAARDAPLHGLDEPDPRADLLVEREVVGHPTLVDVGGDEVVEEPR